MSFHEVEEIGALAPAIDVDPCAADPGGERGAKPQHGPGQVIAPNIVAEMNDMLTKDSNVVIPLVDRGRLSAASTTLGGVVLNTWDTELWNAQDWFRVK